MSQTNSYVYVFMPNGNIIAVHSTSLQEYSKKMDICLNCNHFHQTEDWRDAPEGIYMPRGECRCHAPETGGFPSIHSGMRCGDFIRQGAMASAVRKTPMTKKPSKSKKKDGKSSTMLTPPAR